MFVWRAATLYSVQSDAQSVAPSALDKVRISGWALNMSNMAMGANQTMQITINK